MSDRCIPVSTVFVGTEPSFDYSSDLYIFLARRGKDKILSRSLLVFDQICRIREPFSCKNIYLFCLAQVIFRKQKKQKHVENHLNLNNNCTVSIQVEK